MTEGGRTDAAALYKNGPPESGPSLARRGSTSMGSLTEPDPPHPLTKLPFTLSALRGTVRRRSSFASKLQPLFQADMFQSSDVRQLIRRSSACPHYRSAFRTPILEWFGSRI